MLYIFSFRICHWSYTQLFSFQRNLYDIFTLPGMSKNCSNSPKLKKNQGIGLKFCMHVPFKSCYTCMKFGNDRLSINEKVNGIETIMPYVSYVARLHFFENRHMVSIVLSFQNFTQ